MGIPVASLITVGIWLAGSMFVLTDGQSFRAAVAVLVSGVLTWIPWLLLLRRRRSQTQRIAGALMLVLALALVVWTAIELPAAYEAQQRFNLRVRSVATPNSRP
jgi:hypothetical protein